MKTSTKTNKIKKKIWEPHGPKEDCFRGFSLAGWFEKLGAALVLVFVLVVVLVLYKVIGNPKTEILENDVKKNEIMNSIKKLEIMKWRRLGNTMSTKIKNGNFEKTKIKQH